MPNPIPDAYTELSPLARLVAQTCGVVAPCPLRQTHIVTLLRRAEVRLLGRLLGPQDVRQGKDELLRAHLLKAGNKGYEAHRDWVLPLTRAAHGEGRLHALLNAYVADPPGRTWYEPWADEPLLRAYVVAGDERRLTSLVEEIEDTGGRVDWRFLADPLQPDLLRALPARHQPGALALCLDHTIAVAAAPAPVHELCRQLLPQPAQLLDLLALGHIFQGDFKAAEDLFATLPPSVASSKPAAVGHAASRALVAMLRGQDESAWEHIKAALAAEKAGTRKRLVYPWSRTLSLALLALVRLDTPPAQAFLTETLKAAERNGGPGRELSLVEAAIQAKADSGVFSHQQTEVGVDGLYDALVCCWLEDFNPSATARHKLLVGLRARAVANGYHWIAAECDEVLRRCAKLHRLDGAAAAPVDHAALGTVTLADLAQPAAEWEYSLKALEHLAYAASSTKAKPAAVAAQRLAWVLGDGAYFDLEPRLQRQTKTGRWGKGRPVAARRLVAEAATMDFLSAQDRAAIAAASTERHWNGDHVYFGAALSFFSFFLCSFLSFFLFSFLSFFFFFCVLAEAVGLSALDSLDCLCPLF